MASTSNRTSRDLAVTPYTSTGGAAVLKQPQKFKGLVALVVGKEENEVVLPQTDLARPVPQIFRPNYLLGDLGPPLNKESLSEPQRYLFAITRRAGQYASVPDQDGVNNFFMGIAQAYQEGAQFRPKVDVWKLFRRNIAFDIRTRIIEDGIALTRKIVRHDDEWEVHAPQQLALGERVLQLFGLSLKRVAAEELFSIVDLYLKRCSSAITLAHMQRNGTRANYLQANYDSMTADFKDPKPLRAVDSLSHGKFMWS